jgi:hypothetical protein
VDQPVDRDVQLGDLGDKLPLGMLERALATGKTGESRPVRLVDRDAQRAVAVALLDPRVKYFAKRVGW